MVCDAGNEVEVSTEANAIQELMNLKSDDSGVLWRLKYNVAQGAILPKRDEFWKQLVMALLTSQQKSTEGMPVSKFAVKEPFPLALATYQTSHDEDVVVVIKSNGLRFGPRITGFLRLNYKWLFETGDGWAMIESLLQKLVSQREKSPDANQKTLEREVARVLADNLAGIGPKQSRNLLQELGLTRYEIPLDSRVVGWLNENLNWGISLGDLTHHKTYDQHLDRVQAACQAAAVLPTVFDAAAFVVGKTGVSSPGFSTAPGYVNRGGQVVIRNTGLAGTDHGQSVYQLGCSFCGEVYGANGSDIFQRKCPKCQGGASGLAHE
jgi:hypothetical protein